MTDVYSFLSAVGKVQPQANTERRDEFTINDKFTRIYNEGFKHA